MADEFVHGGIRGIIGCGLAKGKTAGGMAGLYAKRGGEIFHRSLWYKFFRGFSNRRAAGDDPGCWWGSVRPDRRREDLPSPKAKEGGR